MLYRVFVVLWHEIVTVNGHTNSVSHLIADGEFEQSLQIFHHHSHPILLHDGLFLHGQLFMSPLQIVLHALPVHPFIGTLGPNGVIHISDSIAFTVKSTVSVSNQSAE